MLSLEGYMERKAEIEAARLRKERCPRPDFGCSWCSEFSLAVKYYKRCSEVLCEGCFTSDFVRTRLDCSCNRHGEPRSELSYHGTHEVHMLNRFRKPLMWRMTE